ncbi:hypothetical protein ABIA39_008527 [Nocardia sp. GAS34]|uniref:hypothetical protein n=1 Tax=unclassified Nocardia TaxID=2637762 RepID=UPI003D261711
MSDQPEHAPGGVGGEVRHQPDVSFNLLEDGADEVAGVGADQAVEGAGAAESGGSWELAQQIGRALAEVGAPGWGHLEAAIAVTVAAEAGIVTYSDGDRSVQVESSRPVMQLARRQREAVARADSEPWWRLLVRVTVPHDGEDNLAIDVEYDYGEEPFPLGQLFAPDAYRADLQAYPRERLPVWLAAYLSHADRQSRTPQRAAAQARADKAAKVWAVLAENEFPDLSLLWARWVTLAAAFVAVGSEWGPRVLPGGGVFESSKRGGSTLYLLPGGRAVLSGGVWDAPVLREAYADGGQLPNIYAGAPDWVTDLVLNPRAATGLLSFCYWWQGERWYRGESPSARECAMAVPGVWTARTVIEIVASLLAPTANPGEQVAAAEALVDAAEIGVVTRETLVNLFGEGEGVDIDGAMHQFSLAGLTAATAEPIAEDEALQRIHQYIRGRGFDTAGYPLSELVADRFSCGWMVYAPVPEGEIAIGRAIFYVGDDGVLEHSSSSTAPSHYIAEFEQRFRERQGL